MPSRSARTVYPDASPGFEFIPLEAIAGFFAGRPVHLVAPSEPR